MEARDWNLDIVVRPCNLWACSVVVDDLLLQPVRVAGGKVTRGGNVSVIEAVSVTCDQGEVIPLANFTPARSRSGRSPSGCLSWWPGSSRRGSLSFVAGACGGRGDQARDWRHSQCGQGLATYGSP